MLSGHVPAHVVTSHAPARSQLGHVTGHVTGHGRAHHAMAMPVDFREVSWYHHTRRQYRGLRMPEKAYNRKSVGRFRTWVDARAVEDDEGDERGVGVKLEQNLAPYSSEVSSPGLAVQNTLCSKRKQGSETFTSETKLRRTLRPTGSN
eukprot:1684809-Rhodomonas_salina.1